MYGPNSRVDGEVEAVPLVANSNNSRESTVPDTAQRVAVNAVTTDANDWITLPTGVKPGKRIRGWSVVAHELRTLAASGVTVNGVDSDGTNEAAIPATTLWEAEYVSDAAGWILVAWTELGAPVTAIVPD